MEKGPLSSKEMVSNEGLKGQRTKEGGTDGGGKKAGSTTR